MTTFLGMRGNGDWPTDYRPKNWREMILFLYPNGMAPLTAILSMVGSEKTDDPEFNWWTETLSTQGGAVSGVYVDSSLSSAYSSGGVAGQVLYFKCAEAVADEFREGHQALLRDASDYTVDVVGKVTQVIKNGASSYVAVKLLEADDNSSSGDLSDCDTILVIGNINAEGAGIPDAITYDATKYYNYTQIFRTPLSITRTAELTRLRTGNGYQNAKKRAMEYHSIEMEKAFLWGIATEGTGTNGKPERTTQGIIPFVKTNASANTNDYSLNTTYSGKTWIDGGEDWLNYYLEQIFRYGSTEKMALCGSGAMLGLNKLALTYGNIQLQPGAQAYGLKINSWITPFGTLHLKTHPLFSYEATNRNSMLIFEPKLLKERFISNTEFYEDPPKKNTGAARVDGRVEEWLTETGLEIHHPSAFGFLNGVGVDNAV